MNELYCKGGNKRNEFPQNAVCWETRQSDTTSDCITIVSKGELSRFAGSRLQKNNTLRVAQTPRV